MDKRQEILAPCIIKMDEREVVREEDCIDAMDEYATYLCLELLEYVGRNIKWPIIADGEVLFWNGKEYLSKKQLFENFL